MKKPRFRAWQLWTALTVSGTTSLGYALFSDSGDKSVFLPGETTSGHYQIELACGACHSDSFADQEAIQDACNSCHAGELKQANDSHPRDKFTDPRNAKRVEEVDARYCATCHIEHRPEVAAGMGVTLPEDYCYQCHQDIAEERPSHEGMPFNSCDDAGCHNFHDNQALYEDFLAQHLDEPDHLAEQEIVNLLAQLEEKPLSDAEADGQGELSADELAAWVTSAHGRGGVNCTDCHGESEWSDQVSHTECSSCHQLQTDGWLAGKHGMKLAQSLDSMRVSEARQQMHQGAGHNQLSCNSCHQAHRYDTQFASVDACLNCHADDHSKNYKASPHYEAWQAQVDGTGKANTGVSCATCHMPKTKDPETEKVFVQHNQNANLRPNEKMIRTVCIDCHGLGFTLNALADSGLVKTNFDGQPEVDVKSLELVAQRLSAQDQENSK